MYSIGVDIGTSTTEIIISNIKISTRLGPSLLPTTKIDEIEVIYRSPVLFTPLISRDIINFEQIQERVKEAFKDSGIDKENIETGAVIITGETARKDNARQVNFWLSEYLGDFVVAIAGPKLESILAGKGAGISGESKRKSRKIINLDIGGGTLNAAVFDCGTCTDSFAMDIGGRLIQLDDAGNVTYISDRILHILENHKLPIRQGETADIKVLECFCGYLAESCLQALGLHEMNEDTLPLYITDFIIPENLDFISISGGVGEYVGSLKEGQDQEQWFQYGDIGPLLGIKITQALAPYKNRLITPEEKIRATVIGAGSHSLSVSGSTVGVEPSILPMRNIPIVKCPAAANQWEDVFRSTRPLMELYEDDVIAVSIKGEKSPGYEELKLLANQIANLYEGLKSPVIVLLKEDFAKALSQMIRIHTSCSKPVICLDQIQFENGDYIDIGSPVGSAVPVVIKTLVYQS
ncbi:MAG: eutA [Lacrimispora sp.]|nr:eutA [Lacrimispora sp.]